MPLASLGQASFNQVPGLNTSPPSPQNQTGPPGIFPVLLISHSRPACGIRSPSISLKQLDGYVNTSLEQLKFLWNQRLYSDGRETQANIIIAQSDSGSTDHISNCINLQPCLLHLTASLQSSHHLWLTRLHLVELSTLIRLVPVALTRSSKCIPLS